MTATERAAVQQMFAVWKKLPEAEREKYRVLHNELEADAREGGNLKSVMGVVLGLAEDAVGRAQREELRATTEASARMQLVRKFVDEQSRQEQRAHPLEPCQCPASRGPVRPGAAARAGGHRAPSRDSGGPADGGAEEGARRRPSRVRHVRILHATLQKPASPSRPSGRATRRPAPRQASAPLARAGAPAAARRIDPERSGAAVPAGAEGSRGPAGRVSGVPDGGTGRRMAGRVPEASAVGGRAVQVRRERQNLRERLPGGRIRSPATRRSCRGS